MTQIAPSRDAHSQAKTRWPAAVVNRRCHISAPSWLLIIYPLLLLLLVGCGSDNQKPAGNLQANDDVLTKMLRDHRITVGYAGYPPYLVRDPATDSISGYSVDLIKEIMRPIGVRVEWRETTWDAMKQDVLTGKFDLMVEPIFMTIPRSAELGFTRPYAYFGYGVVVVRADESRFRSMADLNNPSLTIAVTQGVTDQEFAERNLPRANLKLIPGGDISITLTEVITGRSDAAIADVPSVLSFLKAHPGRAKALFLENPPASTPAAFMTRRGETEFINFLNNALLYLEANGEFEQLDKRYQLPSRRPPRLTEPVARDSASE